MNKEISSEIYDKSERNRELKNKNKALKKQGLLPLKPDYSAIQALQTERRKRLKGVTIHRRAGGREIVEQIQAV